MMNNGKKTFFVRPGAAISPVDVYVLVALCLTFIWTILSAYVLKIDGAGRIQIFFLLTALVLKSETILKNYFRGPLLIYFLISVYMLVNGILQGGHLNYDVDPYLQIFRKTITPSVFLFLCAYMIDRNQRITIKALYVSMMFYLFVYIFYMLSGAERQINENTAALVMIATSTLLCVGTLKEIFSFRHFILASVCLMGASVIIGSRMGLVVVMFLFMSFVINLNIDRKKGAGSLWTIVLVGLIAAAFLAVVLKYSEVGNRLMSTTEQTDTYSQNLTTGTIFDKFGDRGLQYFFSWPYFLKSPIFGIGLGNWIIFNPQEIVCHSEYLVQYLENGLVSFIPYVIFLASLIRALRKRIRKTIDRGRTALKIVLCAMYGIVFCNFVIWTTDQYSVFVIYSLCYALGHPHKVRMVAVQTVK